MSIFCLRFFLIILLLSDYIILTLHAPVLFAAWREAAVLIYIALTVLIILFQLGVRHTLSQRYKEQIVVFLFFLIFYCLCGDVSEASFRLFRSFAMPVLFALMVNAVCGGLALEVKLKVVFYTLSAMTFISGSYAIYQYLTINDAQQFWYWSLLSEKGFTLEAYNSMRDGKARISGFFTNTLEFSAFVLNTALFAACLLGQAIRQKQYGRHLMVYLFVALFAAVLIVYGSVRTTIIGMVSAVFFLLVLHLLRRRLLVSLLGYSYFLCVTGSIFLYITLGYTEDLSALDRPRQWQEVLSSFNAMPLGVGFSAIGPGQAQWFDSLWLNLLTSSGYVGGAIMIGLICFYSQIVKVAQLLRAEGSAFMRGVGDYMIISYPFFLSTFFFQSYTNSTVLYLFSLVVVMVIYGAKRRAS